MLHLGHRDGLQAALSRRSDASGPAVEAAEVPAARPEPVAPCSVTCKYCASWSSGLIIALQEIADTLGAHAWVHISQIKGAVGIARLS